MGELRFAACVFLLWFMPAGVFGKDRDAATPKDETVTPSVPMPLLATGSPKCDAAGNIYVRAYEPREANAVISRYSRDGRDVTQLSPGADALRNFNFADYALEGNGEVASLLNHQGEPGMEIIELDKNGRAVKTVALMKPAPSDYVRGDGLAVFSSGRFLVYGIVRYGSDASPLPFFGIFAANGVFVSDLYYPGDGPVEARKFRFLDMSTTAATQAGLSIAQVSGDFVYLAVDAPSGPEVLAVRDSGGIERHTRLAAAGYKINNFLAHEDLGLLEFAMSPHDRRTEYSLLKLDTGETTFLGEDAVPDVGPVACYETGGLATFEHGNSWIRHVVR